MAAALDGHMRERVATTTPRGYLFPSPTGGVWTNTNFRARSRWMDATKAAGVEGTTIHDLRHTAASLLIAAGAAPAIGPAPATTAADPDVAGAISPGHRLHP